MNRALAAIRLLDVVCFRVCLHRACPPGNRRRHIILRVTRVCVLRRVCFVARRDRDRRTRVLMCVCVYGHSCLYWCPFSRFVRACVRVCPHPEAWQQCSQSFCSRPPLASVCPLVEPCVWSPGEVYVKQPCRETHHVFDDVTR